ncbi:bifunctional diguanylate cyclase/phosphodiesterase [Bradyrhizobium roseum]|uniref:bifunctional diguanylate cyclase/phosphodiesterase n=1 Tax=Bradyrhizobium roseum TaxID=3056648 RepID=UPI0026256271|nr:EAL domain-containing protein [Bradyrhizobium roseus]WKA28502.1 EAL domain-containing protein [Bradyrhizobium roseus]
MSIRVRLLLLILGTLLVPAILVGERYYQDRSKEISAAVSGLATTARGIATSIDAKVQGTTQLHFGLSRARDLDSRDKAACSKFLTEVLEKNPDFTGILTIKPDGSLFCDSLNTGRVLDLRDRGYFQRALKNPDTVAIEPAFGRLTGAAVLQIAYPAYDESRQLRFVLLASLDLNRLMKDQLQNLPPGVEFLLVDDKGTIFVRSPAPHRAEEQAGASIANSARHRLALESAATTRELARHGGDAEVWATAHTIAVGGVGLHVLLGRSKSELVAAAERRLAEDMGALAILSIVLFVGVGLFAEFGIRSQIGRIAKMAQRLGAGDLTARVAPPYPGGEFGSLMTVLNHTASSLELQRRDIEELNQKLRQAQELEALEKQRLDVAVNNMAQGLILYDASERVVICNRQFTKMLGMSPLIVKPGCTFREAIAHRRETGSLDTDVEEYRTTFLRNIAAGNHSPIVSTMSDGRSIQIVGKGIEGGGWVATVEDITERKRVENRIAHMAHYDALTDLPNRVLFRERLDHELKNLSPGRQLAVLYIDIDEFKRINDSLGHPVGDELLKAVAGRLGSCVAAGDVVARLGGDEFAIIQAAIERPADTMDLITRIYQAIREPYECFGHLLTTDASIGIARAPQEGTDLDHLLKNADLAMYEAKADGRRTYRFFEPGMGARMHALRMLELDLRQAIADGGFEIVYQPLVNIGDTRVTGCEALLRWRHPLRGMISPVEFIPVAEDTGMINELGDWVLNKACSEAASWPDDVRVAVNVSPVQFRNPAFSLKVAAALANSGLPARRLELEITEAVLIRDDDAALAMLYYLRGLGVRIALDDFGTGYSSLSYLQRFPFDKIKIDRCFIKEVAEPDGSACIVRAIVNIAAARHMTTTAEGVETEAQLDALRGLECTEMQGYLFSKPLPAADIQAMLTPDRRRIADTA